MYFDFETRVTRRCLYFLTESVIIGCRVRGVVFLFQLFSRTVRYNSFHADMFLIPS